MIIREMFAKDIDRDIKGVIKVGQGDDVNIRQELEEYVVTKELQKHIAHFFSNYKKGINGNTDKMGVWISGFFGSGKSHLLKIISYLLENKEVDGKKAVDYFLDEKKISDNLVIGDIKLASQTPTDVILFNIDSKGEVGGKQNKDAIVSVFLKVFNEMLGFCGSMPFLADLERKLTDENKYEGFKTLFLQKVGQPWDDARNDFHFIQDDIVDVLVEMDYMSEPAARNWCEKSTENYTISIGRFAELVKKYIDSKGKNHHVVFLVDEIGQYIGGDSKLMLNLQTITEDLGTYCNGKAWIIVTSQEDIDSITKVRGDDFSKIQGRFETRLSLSATNVDEVIKKRILAKTSAAKQSLELLYEQKATIIKNLIVFNDGAEKKLFTDRGNFAEIYPFVPYQFNLLGSVLTSIRTHGASGKHLAEGARSMLALYKESAVAYKDSESGVLIPVNIFYNAIQQFLDHSHRGVILTAEENTRLEAFDIEVLKTLFMIKYVKEIEKNLDNIVSLMVSNIDEDRIELTKKIEESLKRLVRQTLVQKSGDIYIFLTNEEQEINREIDNQPVEMADVIQKVSELIFEDLYAEKRYKYNDRYSFAFNQIVDDRLYKNNQTADIGLMVITPNYTESTEETTLRMMSGQGKNVIALLPGDAEFLDELSRAMKIEKYLRRNAGGSSAKFEELKAVKQVELRERNGRAKTFLTQALQAADIYVNGDKLQSKSKEIVSRLNEAMEKLVTTVYNKLSYINAAMSEGDIYTLFKGMKQITLDDDAAPNQLALDEVQAFIKINAIRHAKTSMKTLLERFMKAPYGFKEEDVEWLVAKLFKDGLIELFLNSENITLHNKTAEELVRFITKKDYVEKLLTDECLATPVEHINAAREVMKELFGVSTVNNDADSIMSSCKRYAANTIVEMDKLFIQYENQPKFPGKAAVSKGKQLLKEIVQLDYAREFYQAVFDKKSDLLDLSAEYEPVKAFFAGEQKPIFEKALKLMAIYDDSKTYIVDSNIETTVAAIKAIITKASPFGEIYKLPPLLETFTNLYGELLTKMAEPLYAEVETARERVMKAIEESYCHDKFDVRVKELFDELKEKLKHCNNVATLKSISFEADALKLRLLNEIEKSKPVSPPEKCGEGQPPENPPKRTKSVSIRTVTSSASWQIETEAELDNYLKELKARIMKEINDDTIINLEF